MEMRSRGVAPMAFNALTTSPRLTPPGTTIRLWSSALTETLESGVTTVAPPGAIIGPVAVPGGTTVVFAPSGGDGAKGRGWETDSFSLIWILRFPWAMATVEMRTL